MSNLVLTAGFDRALHVLALAELLSRGNHKISAIIVVNPINLKRLKTVVRQRGFKFVGNAVKRVTGKSGGQTSLMNEFLDKHEVEQRSLKSWASDNNVPYHVVTNLNAPESLAVLHDSNCDGVLYGGGGILRSRFIQAASSRVLNAHSGPLPEIRGMNACEWSILLGYEPAVTIHFIDEGIDTGPLVKQYTIPVTAKDTIETLREKCTVTGVEGMLECITALDQPVPEKRKDAGAHRQCYIMAPAIKSLLEMRLNN